MNSVILLDKLTLNNFLRNTASILFKTSIYITIVIKPLMFASIYMLPRSVKVRPEISVYAKNKEKCVINVNPKSFFLP